MYQLVNPRHPEYDLINGQLPLMAKLFARANGRQGLPVNERAMLAEVRLAVAHPGRLALATIGPMVIGFTTGKPWWAFEHILQEEFIFRYKDGNHGDMMDPLYELARDYGCKGVAIGDMALTGQAAEHYGRFLLSCGFRDVARQFYREVP